MSRIPSNVAAVLSIEARKKGWYAKLEDWLLNLSPPTIGGVELRDMSRFNLTVPIASLYVITYTCILIGLTFYGTRVQLNTKYLALDTNDPNSICKEVPQSVSGTYEGTWDGYWVTDQEFDFAKSLFAIEFTGSAIDVVDYHAAMQSFADKLAAYGEMAKNRNIAWAMLLYGSYSFNVPSARMRFYSTAEGSSLFFNKVQSISLSGRNGICNPYPTTDQFISGSFDRPTKSLLVTVPIIHSTTNLKAMGDGFNASLTSKFEETCPNITKFFNPLAFNPALGSNRESLGFHFDINTIITVLSLNLGITKASDLTKISAKINLRVGDPYPILNYDDLVAYIDPISYSPDRVPVYCYDKTSPALKLSAAQVAGPDICFLGSHEDGQENVVLFFPTMAQVWNNPKRMNSHMNAAMQVCKCPLDKVTETLCRQHPALKPIH